jgi:hypothetical protein
MVSGKGGWLMIKISTTSISPLRLAGRLADPHGDDTCDGTGSQVTAFPRQFKRFEKNAKKQTQ